MPRGTPAWHSTDEAATIYLPEHSTFQCPTHLNALSPTSTLGSCTEANPIYKQTSYGHHEGADVFPDLKLVAALMVSDARLVEQLMDMVPPEHRKI